jgi:hypothetical protein
MHIFPLDLFLDSETLSVAALHFLVCRSKRSDDCPSRAIVFTAIPEPEISLKLLAMDPDMAEPLVVVA